MWARLNRAARMHDLAMYVTAPDHGSPGVVAAAWLEGTYSELYPAVSRDGEGWRGFSGNSPCLAASRSHAALETPGAIREGGELGYSLAHAFGAAFDNPICWSPASCGCNRTTGERGGTGRQSAGGQDAMAASG